jgi:hypothetical protein
MGEGQIQLSCPAFALKNGVWCADGECPEAIQMQMGLAAMCLPGEFCFCLYRHTTTQYTCSQPFDYPKEFDWSPDHLVDGEFEGPIAIDRLQEATVKNYKKVDIFEFPSRIRSLFRSTKLTEITGAESFEKEFSRTGTTDCRRS